MKKTPIFNFWIFKDHITLGLYASNIFVRIQEYLRYVDPFLSCLFYHNIYILCIYLYIFYIYKNNLKSVDKSTGIDKVLTRPNRTATEDVLFA